MKTKSPTRAAIVVFAVILIAGCKKYEEGPLISFRSAESRLCKIWNFQNVTINGEDHTADYALCTIEFTDGHFEVFDGDSSVIRGSWALLDKNKKISMNYISSFQEYYGGIYFSWSLQSNSESSILQLKNKNCIIEGSENIHEVYQFDFNPPQTLDTVMNFHWELEAE